MGEVWGLRLSHGQQVVMLALADHAHDDGTHCYPGVPYLAWKTGYSERNVTRLLGELEEDGLIEPQGGKRGGYGNRTEYHIHLEKGDKKGAFKGDNSRKRVTNAAPERVTTRANKGDSPSENPDNPDEKGDNSPRADRDEPPGNRHGEPSGEASRARGAPPTPEPLPDDTTAACLLVLKKVNGIGKDYGELALLLAELRTEYPGVDALKVCKEYELYHRRPPKPTRNHPLKLRRFFETASTPKRNGKPPPTGQSVHQPADAAPPGKYAHLLEGG